MQIIQSVYDLAELLSKVKQLCHLFVNRGIGLAAVFCAACETVSLTRTTWRQADCLPQATRITNAIQYIRVRIGNYVTKELVYTGEAELEGRHTAVIKSSLFCWNVLTASERRWWSVSATCSMLYGASSFSDNRSRSSDHTCHLQHQQQPTHPVMSKK